MRQIVIDTTRLIYWMRCVGRIHTYTHTNTHTQIHTHTHTRCAKANIGVVTVSIIVLLVVARVIGGGISDIIVASSGVSARS